MFSLKEKLKELPDGIYRATDSNELYGFDQTFVVINHVFYKYMAESMYTSEGSIESSVMGWITEIYYHFHDFDRLNSFVTWFDDKTSSTCDIIYRYDEKHESVTIDDLMSSRYGFMYHVKTKKGTEYNMYSVSSGASIDGEIIDGANYLYVAIDGEDSLHEMDPSMFDGSEIYRISIE